MATDYASQVIDPEPGMTEFEQPAGNGLLHAHMEEQSAYFCCMRSWRPKYVSK